MNLFDGECVSKDQPKNSRTVSGPGDAAQPSGAEEDLLPGEIRRRKPPKEAVEAAFQRFQSIAAEADVAERAAEARASAGEACPTCGHKNRPGNRFCAMCGHEIVSTQPEISTPPHTAPEEPSPAAGEGSTPAAHHHHHHYHYHYFPGGADGARKFSPGMREVDKPAVSLPTPVKSEGYSRAETAIRRLTQDWVIACNTKHLEDVLDLYAANAIVYRSNQPAVQSASALREHFVASLEAGLGEISMEPARVEISGDMAYEAGKFTALLPGAAGKRREERGKYVRVLAKDSDGDWKISVDCWSSDLTLG